MTPAATPPLPFYVPKRWLIAPSVLTAPHDCTVHGIQLRCGGGCCTAGPSGKYWPGRSGEGGRCVHLGPVGCTLPVGSKPVTCLLYPLRVVNDRRIVLHHRTRLPHSVCRGNYGQGPELGVALAEPLVSLFGPGQYARVMDAARAGHESYFQVPQAVEEALAAEREWEAANLPPVPRGGPKDG